MHYAVFQQTTAEIIYKSCRFRKRLYGAYELESMSDMTRLTKLTELLYFKGKINNKCVDLELSNNKEITSDFTIILSIAL